MRTHNNWTEPKPHGRDASRLNRDHVMHGSMRGRKTDSANSLEPHPKSSARCRLILLRDSLNAKSAHRLQKRATAASASMLTHGALHKQSLEELKVKVAQIQMSRLAPMEGSLRLENSLDAHETLRQKLQESKYTRSMCFFLAPYCSFCLLSI